MKFIQTFVKQDHNKHAYQVNIGYRFTYDNLSYEITSLKVARERVFIYQYSFSLPGIVHPSLFINWSIHRDYLIVSFNIYN